MDLRGKDGKVEPALVQHLVSVENPEIGGVRDADDSGDCANKTGSCSGSCASRRTWRYSSAASVWAADGSAPSTSIWIVAGIEPSDAGLTTTYLRGPTTRVPA